LIKSFNQHLGTGLMDHLVACINTALLDYAIVLAVLDTAHQNCCPRFFAHLVVCRKIRKNTLETSVTLPSEPIFGSVSEHTFSTRLFLLIIFQPIRCLKNSEEKKSRRKRFGISINDNHY